MKKHPHLDAAIVAALLLACTPDLTETVLPDQQPIAIMFSTPDGTNENPAEGL